MVGEFFSFLDASCCVTKRQERGEEGYWEGKRDGNADRLRPVPNRNSSEWIYLANEIEEFFEMIWEFCNERNLSRLGKNRKEEGIRET